ncbi:MAG: TM0106 family RecB-like putative nuclease [Actinomycetota bacterium]
MAKKIITSEVFVAYSQCPRKAFLLLFSDEQGIQHDYSHILEERRKTNQVKYLESFKQTHENAKPYVKDLRKGEFLTEATLTAECWESYCDVLTEVDQGCSGRKLMFEPTIVVGTYSITKEQRTELLFIGKVLGKIQKQLPAAGTIVGMDGKRHRVKLEGAYKSLTSSLKTLEAWMEEKPAEPPALILNKSCPSCQFRELCREQAVKEDNLSLLDRITQKAIQKYNRKGVFTIHQLSYLFKPRRNRKRQVKLPVKHNVELQALAIKEQKIYIQELLELTRKPVELFLDIESIPDQNFYYLISLLVCEGENSLYYSFWADQAGEEENIWRQLIGKLNEFPKAPIYHYGNYEIKAINELKKRYSLKEDIENQFINLNSYIYGKIYFPIFSNGLKEVGNYIGFSWNNSKASGIQSIAWRYFWEETQNDEYKRFLIRYNQEDCRVLAFLANKISEIVDTANSTSQINFADSFPKYATKDGEQVHRKFEIILKFAHADYDKNKIKLRQGEEVENLDRNREVTSKERHRTHRKIVPKARRLVEVPRMLTCPKHLENLRESNKIAEKTIIDLSFLRSGIKKTITKYFGVKSYCPKCNHYYRPPEISKYSSPQVYGHGFQIWVAYQRVALRLPHRTIVQAIEDQFNEIINSSTIRAFVNYVANYYAETEKLLLQSLLQSPFLHVDETTANIQGTTWYVWVLTDKKHVIFRLTKTREIENVREILSNYRGILISDFYSGYDSLSCKQQKCWVHLIRDLNNDLWKEPFDTEFETFVLNVKELILPIFETIEKYGLKQTKLLKYKKEIDFFYESNINDKIYKSELVIRYQKRFARYKESLFTFMDGDEIPWHNNTAENAIRHFARQRDASGSLFESSTTDYLLLLGIKQSCRFQGKSFLKFLLSDEKDLSKFKASKYRKNSIPVGLS